MREPFSPSAKHGNSIALAEGTASGQRLFTLGLNVSKGMDHVGIVVLALSTVAVSTAPSCTLGTGKLMRTLLMGRFSTAPHLTYSVSQAGFSNLSVFFQLVDLLILNPRCLLVSPILLQS